MDEFSSDDCSDPCIGDEFDIELSASLLDEDESWETIFSGNPERRKALEHINGWSYRAFGEIVSIDPVVVDCGMIQIPEVIDSKDPGVIGEFVAFTITRLDATYNTAQETEQPGTGQPATRPVDKPEGSDKPQPDAEGRSR
jgi:hypothetical protein